MKATLFTPPTSPETVATVTPNPPGSMELYAWYACEVLKMPAGWRVYSWNCAEEVAPKGFVQIKGSVCPNKRDGTPDWKKEDKATEKTLFVEKKPLEAFLQAKADERGVCVECWGTKKRWAGWSAAEGTRWRVCEKCATPPDETLASA